jgi:dTDP-glucose 4,6-dehydratase
VHSQHEDYKGNVSTTGIRSVYDEAKRYAEALTTAYHRHYRLDTRIARIFNSYGPKMREDDGRMVPNFIRQALVGEPLTVYGEGTQTRSVQYVDDLIEGVIRLMDSEETRPVNIGNPDAYSVLEIAEIVIELCGSQSEISHQPLPEDDPKQRCPDITRAREELGWEPQIPAREGLAKTLSWFASQAKARTPTEASHITRGEGA